MKCIFIIITTLNIALIHSSRFKRQGSVVGRSCTQNPECGTGAYCDGTKRCTCLSTYTDIDGYCWTKVNPDQGGCSRNKQCSAVWPDAYCSSGTCKCGNNQPSHPSRDGLICVNYGFCPINGRYTKFQDPVVGGAGGDYRSCVLTGTTTYADLLCPESYDCICGQEPSAQTCAGSAFCCPSRAFACIQRRDIGNGGTGGVGYVTRYWHNPVTDGCEAFQYRGTGGNANNFLTQDQCVSYCKQACKRGNPLYTSPTAADKGSITYCSSTSSTACGNTNYECYTVEDSTTSLCCPTVAYVCSKNGGLGYGIFGTPSTNYDPGSLAGSSTTTYQRWYYDVGLNRCTSFTYRGHAGNFNNFLTEEHCSSYCAKSLCVAGEPLKDQGGVSNLNCGSSRSSCPGTHECRNSVCCPTKQTVCTQLQDSGGCTNYVDKWWYNARIGSCELFKYGGCQGNDNRFDTYTACSSFCRDLQVEPQCVQGTAQTDSNGNFFVCSGTNGRVTSCSANYQCYYDGNTWGCCPSKAYTCSQSSDSGKICAGPIVTRWFYDQGTQRCDTYSYNGCDGNSNNFATQTDCEDYCGVGGCPDGGTPYRQGNGQFLPCDNSAGKCPENYYCKTVRIGTDTTRFQYCCANKAAVCRASRREGIACTATALNRWFFNRITRNCEQFSFAGCDGNRNNFATRAQCLSYCNSADCPIGQVALVDSTSNTLTTCPSSGSSCSQSGYSCTESLLFSTFICCGSSAAADTCPAGLTAYIDSSTSTPRTCQPNVDLDCPAAYICWFAANYAQYYCCGRPGEFLCPSGSSPWINPSTNQVQVCTPGNNAVCAAGYSCRNRNVTVGGIVSVTGTCCSSVTTICGTGLTPVQLNGENVHCHPVSANVCQAPAICRQSVVNPREYFCCAGNATDTVSMCGARRPYMIGNNPVICASGVASLNCPAPYQCVLYAPSNVFYCCSDSSALGSCPTGSSELLSNGQIQTCSPQTGCPSGYYCQFSSGSNRFLCCSSPFVPVPTPSCPIGYVPALTSTDQPIPCSSTSCISPQVCAFMDSGKWCCTPPMIVDEFGCQTGNSYLYPGTQLPLICTMLTANCPSSYSCVRSVRYAGERQCCSLVMRKDMGNGTLWRFV